MLISSKSIKNFLSTMKDFAPKLEKTTSMVVPSKGDLNKFYLFVFTVFIIFFISNLMVLFNSLNKDTLTSIHHP